MMVIMPAFLYCMCFLGTFLQLQPVSTADDEIKFDIGARFRKQVNGFEFGPISMLSTIISNATYAADDLMIPGNIVISIGGVLKSYSPKTGYLYPVESSTNQPMFKNILGFLQTSASEILVVDYNNNCIALVIRQKGNFKVPTLAGKCGKPNGYKDGPALEARFAHPTNIKESPTRNVFYVIERASHLRQFNTVEKKVTTLFKYHHKVIDVTLSDSNEVLYVATICGVLAYEIITDTLQQLMRLGDNCGFSDGGIHSEARFSLPYSMVLLNAFTILLADHQWNNLRVIDLCSNRTSTICIPTRDDSTFLASEEPTSCSLTEPHTLIFSSAIKSVLILSYGISAILPMKDEHFHCDPSLLIKEDKTRQHETALRLYSYDVHFLPIPVNEKRKLHYLCSSETAAYENWCFPAWCVTASEDERIELKFDSLRLPAGAELVIYDGMLIEDQSLILEMNQRNAHHHINKTVLSTGNHITFTFAKQFPALESGFSLDYNTYGYIAPTERSVAVANQEGNEHDDEETVTGITDIVSSVIAVAIIMVLKYLHRWLSDRHRGIVEQHLQSNDEDSRTHEGVVSERNISHEGDQSDATTNDLGHDSGESNEFNSTDGQKPRTKSGGDDRYHNLKLKNTLADNNIDPVQDASASDINLQLDDNKKCNIDYKKDKVIPEIVAD